MHPILKPSTKALCVALYVTFLCFVCYVLVSQPKQSLGLLSITLIVSLGVHLLGLFMYLMIEVPPPATPLKPITATIKPLTFEEELAAERAQTLWNTGNFEPFVRAPAPLQKLYLAATPDEQIKFLERIYGNCYEAHELSAKLIDWEIEWLLYDFHRQFPHVPWHWSSAWVLVRDSEVLPTNPMLPAASRAIGNYLLEERYSRKPLYSKMLSPNTPLALVLSRVPELEQLEHLQQLLLERSYRVFARMMEHSTNTELYARALEDAGMSMHEVLQYR